MPILDRLDHLHRAKAIEGDLPFHSVYTAGLAGERFLRALKDDGMILGARCGKCGTTFVPGRLYCERCFAEIDASSWFDAGTTGCVHTFTVMHIGLDGKPLANPRVVAYIEIGETQGGIVHYLGEVEPGDVFIGMNVEAVLKSSEARAGSITDILHFRPLG
jgi:uncharacterized OB-fold protein